MTSGHPAGPEGLGVARRADPGTLREVARSLAVEAGRLEDRAAALRAGAPPGWTGPAADEARGRGGALVLTLRGAGEDVSAARTVLLHAARELAAAGDLVRRAEVVARAEGGTVDRAGRFVAPAAALPADPALVAADVRRRARAAAEVECLTSQAAATARAADLALSRALAAGAGRAPVARPRAPAVPEGMVRPWAGGLLATPYAAAAWWRSLSTEQRRRMLRERPDVVGPLDGVPAGARHEANLALLARAEQRAARALAAVESGRVRRPEAVLGVGLQGLTAGRPERRRVAELAALRSVLERDDGVARRLLLVDDSRPLLRAVVAVGDPDTAAHVATYVGGLTTSVGGDLGRYDTVLRAARDAAAGRPLGADLAVVTWMGYEAPQVTEVLDPRGRSVLGEAVAVAAAPALARFLVGLDAAREDDPHLTVWAHSYGSVVAGHTLRLNTGVDDVVLFGSPGVAVEGLAAAGLKPGALNVLRAPYDVVGHSGWHRRDPSDIPGATLLGTGAALAPDGTRLKASSGHSSYLVPGSTSAWNLVAVAVGRRDLAVRVGTAR